MSAFRQCLLRWADARSFGTGEGCAYDKVKVPQYALVFSPGCDQPCLYSVLAMSARKRASRQRRGWP